jgi:hypothetical protein
VGCEVIFRAQTVQDGRTGILRDAGNNVSISNRLMVATAGQSDGIIMTSFQIALLICTHRLLLLMVTHSSAMAVCGVREGLVSHLGQSSFPHRPARLGS